ncbi:iron uptake transporter deferrochelatase/peroxidase subunit [Streptomyces sp. NBC_01497]|uniref:iron uptake transporter deferrochelatase/peroxidase subunit n=1 Tax=Streptomyces sp. NBC_01497 TaxID=2903885 RepID=UPI002E33D4F6|nr:iron uptake transporter deferrochelatase/peroxidase subunit [Streptomyces sp. NBC_01497]
MTETSKHPSKNGARATRRTTAGPAPTDGRTAGGPSAAPAGSGSGSDSDSAGNGGGTGEGAASGGVSRRRLLGAAGAAGAGGLVVGAGGGIGAYAATRPAGPAPLTGLGSHAVAFHGAHQAGITTPPQAAGHLAAFDLAPGAGRAEAVALMRRWTACAAPMAEGRPAPDHDTGIALDAGPAALTVTFGFGHGFFDRTGLTKQRPVQLDPLPAFSSDHLDPARSNGDLWVQIGSDDALVAFHALRALLKAAGAAARLRWQMSGFNRSPGATPHPMTPRNLMGQIDGTGNPKQSAPRFDEQIFVPSKPAATGSPLAAPAWMANGSYAVVRRIRMLLDDWEKLPLSHQEKVIGRRKSDGAPLTGGTEDTAMALTRTGQDGQLVIPADAHARIAQPAANGGAAMLRRAYSYNDGVDADGAPDAGLLFVAWQADPLKGFVPVQRKLDRGDALSAFIRHEASGLFAVPGGAAPGEYVGQRLLES